MTLENKRYFDLDRTIKDREQFGEDPVQEVKNRLLCDTYNGSHQERGYLYGCPEQFNRDDPRFLKELTGQIEYCEVFYASREAQWRIIESDIKELEIRQPLAASKYYEAFGKIGQAKELKCAYLDKIIVFDMVPKCRDAEFALQLDVKKMVSIYGQLGAFKKAQDFLAKYNLFCEERKRYTELILPKREHGYCGAIIREALEIIVNPSEYKLSMDDCTNCYSNLSEWLGL